MQETLYQSHFIDSIVKKNSRMTRALSQNGFFFQRNVFYNAKEGDAPDSPTKSRSDLNQLFAIYNEGGLH